MKKQLLLFLSIITFACSENDEPQVQSSGNVFIINEGSFGASNASIDIYNTTDTTYQLAAYKNTNGDFIGDVIQDVEIDNNIAYAVLNGSNRVVSFSLADLKTIDTLQASVIDKPRYMTIDGNKAYLTVWGPYGENYSLTDSKIVVIDLTTFEIESTIATEPGVEQILEHSGKLYVSRNYYGAYNNLTIIDIASETILADLRIATGPDEIFVDNQNRVWVACSSGALVEIDTNTDNVSQTINLNGEILSDVEFFEGKVYYYQGNAVKAVDLNSPKDETIIDNVELGLPYAFSINPDNGDIYLGDGVAYGSEGEFIHYTSDGEFVAAFTSGILPTQFIFR